MSVKDSALAFMPQGFDRVLRRLLYRRNCRLHPTRYRKALERWYCITKGRACDLDDPQTLGEKIQWLKLYDSTPLKGRLADKYLVRTWVAERVGTRYLVPLLGVWDDPDRIDFEALPNRFVLKATHGSGWNIVVDKKNGWDADSARRQLAAWLATRTAMTGGFELHYEFCEPRIIAERYLEDESGALRDYKFVTIDGEVQFILAIEGRYADEVSCVYDAEWNQMPFSYGYRVGRPGEIPKPSNLGEMRTLAERLGTFPFARLDFYEVDHKVYFGEITFTAANGLSEFAPSEFDRAYGAKVVLPEKKPYKGIFL